MIVRTIFIFIFWYRRSSSIRRPHWTPTNPDSRGVGLLRQHSSPKKHLMQLHFQVANQEPQLKQNNSMLADLCACWYKDHFYCYASHRHHFNFQSNKISHTKKLSSNNKSNITKQYLIITSNLVLFSKLSQDMETQKYIVIRRHHIYVQRQSRIIK